MTHAERSIRCHEAEIESLRHRLRPGMIVTSDERLDIERRIAENEQLLEQWKAP